MSHLGLDEVEGSSRRGAYFDCDSHCSAGMGRNERPAVAGGARRRGLLGCLLVMATAGSLVLLPSAQAMPYDADWGDTWSDGSGVLASEVMALADFYSCSVAGDDVMYKTQASCRTACFAGVCTAMSATGHLSAPQLVQVYPNTTHARHVVFTTLSPVIHVGDTVRMLIKTTDPTITITVQEDPGLPIGMTSTVADDGLAVQWTPRVGQEGAVHEVRQRPADQLCANLAFVHCRHLT